MWSVYLSEPHRFVWYNRRLQRIRTFDLFEEELLAGAAAIRSERRAQMSRKMLTPRQSWSGGGSGRETIRVIYYQAIRVFCTVSTWAWVEGLAAT